MLAIVSRVFTVLRGAIYSAAFIGLWTWLAFYVRRFDSQIPLMLPAWLVPVGLLLAFAGGLVAAACIAIFVTAGHGTPAPFDPPRQFVAVGPYRYVRNPMYLGAASVLLGAGLIISSPAVALLALGFLLLMHLFVVLHEEEALAGRFGDNYLRYKATVHRWLIKRPHPGASVPTRQLGWLLPIAFALHELEEWNIIAWYQRYWTNVDPTIVNQRNSWTWLAFASLLGFAWTFLASRFRNLTIMFHILLVFFIPVFSHSLAHVYWLFSFGVYAPGVVTSIILIIPITAYVTYRAIRDRFVSGAYAAVIFALTLFPTVWAIRLSNRLPDEGIPFLRFSSWLADLLFPQAA